MTYILEKVRQTTSIDCPLCDDEFLAALKIMMDENKIVYYELNHDPTKLLGF